MSATTEPLHDFEPWPRTSPFGDAAGPLFVHRDRDPLTFAVRIAERHTNARGTAHGGALGAIADMALGYAAAMSTDPPTPLHTASLSIDYLAPARTGDVVIIRPRLLRLGRRVANADATLMVGDRAVARASSTLIVE